ncbi:decaprenylphospho-beta-D-erythro-pentofuranosid-2-ulose 2-reductase [Nocardioides sp. CFH 31398]|uniref:decaprenylphospho-beta-D-erythro-pentofuranosid- 2-ulose 2-reductase n=1 Tax=Nocardioides sp. CFH 31398 TaxID=2919579 RepID=UPI001F0688CF|nr:decaprenylphospho-beta-D-erythro-pentofuranosid-2-ulose 2-reductase [Nocardioides sp. CFH 31398]MCH1868801.1 decaprenylphospho-beta-D-erythro-pentofuranosid-2-ulose 2-reductase [Nocardioides sp. CFH 31398]
MTDAVGDPRSLLLMGGTSEIALAIAERYARRVPGLHVTLAARPSQRRAEAAGLLSSLGCTVAELDLDAEAPETHAAVVEAATADRDVDVAVVAYGLLGDPEEAWTDVDAGVRLARVNYVGPVATGIALADRVRRQGHGTVVALSSVAGERPRRSNFVYGSTKAGFDAFYTGLGEALREHGGRVVVVRPGFVHSRMTAGLDPAPLAVRPEDVAQAVVAAVDGSAEQVWVPAAMRPVMSVLRHVPRRVFRRLPL